MKNDPWHRTTSPEARDRSFPTLDGSCHRAPNRNDVVRAYAEYFGVEAIDPYGNGRYIEARAKVRGVWVRVYALRDGVAGERRSAHPPSVGGRAARPGTAWVPSWRVPV